MNMNLELFDKVKVTDSNRLAFGKIGIITSIVGEYNPIIQVTFDDGGIATRMHFHNHQLSNILKEENGTS